MTYKEILEEFTSIINVAKFVDSDYATSPLRVEVLEEAVSLYNRLNEEIGRLADRNHKCIYLSDEETTNYCVDGPCPKFKTEAQIRADAVKEFAEGLKFLVGQFFQYEDNYRDPKSACKRAIDMALKQFTGETT